MKWILITEDWPPSHKPVLVKYPDGRYEALRFKNDQEYGFIAVAFEGYITPMDCEKWCLIEE